MLPRTAGRAVFGGVIATLASSLPAFTTTALTVFIAEDLGFGPLGTGAAVGVYFAVVALSSPYQGGVADRLGAMRSLRLSTFTSGVSALVIAVLARNWLSLASGLVLAALGSALAQPAANRLLSRVVRHDRLGVAFGVKQATQPGAAMLAGLAVPLVAVTIGWRWVFVFAGLFIFSCVLLLGRGDQERSPGVHVHDATANGRIRNLGTLLVLAIGFGCSFAGSSAALAFYVPAAVAAGTATDHAGLVYALASLAAIVTRVASGVACDRLSTDPLMLCTGLLGLGAIGLGLIAVGSPTLMAIGMVVGLAGTWGFPSAFWVALIRAYPDTPGRVSGAVAPAALGGVLGPIGFGALTEAIGYPIAWAIGAGVVLLGTGFMFHGARRLADRAIDA